MRNWFYIFFIFLSTCLFCSCEKKGFKELTPKPGAKKVKIGVIAPFSGPDRTKGKNGFNGIKTAKHLKPFLYNGDWIELIIEDDEDNPELSVKALKKLVEVDEVSAVLLLSSSKSALAVNKVADDFKTPILALLATHSDIALKSKYISQACFDNDFQGKVAALFARDELLISKVAVFENSGSLHSTSLAKVFKEKFIAVDGTVSHTVALKEETKDLKSLLVAMQENKTELLYLPVHAADFIKISKILKEINWEPVRMGSDGLLSTIFFDYPYDVDLLEGVIAVDLYSTNINVSPDWKILKKTYNKLFYEQGSTYTVAGVEGYLMLFNAINRCKNFNDRKEINQKLRDTIDFEGLMGKITINSNGKAKRPLVVNTIEDGELVFLVKVY